jgi:hypothetical protein
LLLSRCDRNDPRPTKYIWVLAAEISGGGGGGGGVGGGGGGSGSGDGNEGGGGENGKAELFKVKFQLCALPDDEVEFDFPGGRMSSMVIPNRTKLG